jgi:hypothetical protein
MQEKTYSDIKDCIFAINHANTRIKQNQLQIDLKILELSALLMAMPIEDREKIQLKIDSDELVLGMIDLSKGKGK